MLEVRYNKITKEITGWWGNRFGNEEVKLKDRPDEEIVTLDIPVPNMPLEALLYDETTQSLIPNPDYTPPIADPDTLRAQEILGTSPDAITAPEQWELLRIFGKKLGYRFE